MLTKTIAAAALAAALVSGSASMALAQYASPGPTYVPEGYYATNGYTTLHQRHNPTDTNGW